MKFLFKKFIYSLLLQMCKKTKKNNIFHSTTMGPTVTSASHRSTLKKKKKKAHKRSHFAVRREKWSIVHVPADMHYLWRCHSGLGSFSFHKWTHNRYRTRSFHLQPSTYCGKSQCHESPLERINEWKIFKNVLIPLIKWACLVLNGNWGRSWDGLQ